MDRQGIKNFLKKFLDYRYSQASPIYKSLSKGKSNKGQLAIEAVLLMTVLVAVFLVILKFIQGPPNMVQKLLTDSVTEKFRTITGFGTWKPDGCTSPTKPKQTLGKCHPNSIHRSLSSDPGI